jgi:hypothetical protein
VADAHDHAALDAFIGVTGVRPPRLDDRRHHGGRFPSNAAPHYAACLALDVLDQSADCPFCCGPRPRRSDHDIHLTEAVSGRKTRRLAMLLTRRSPPRRKDQVRNSVRGCV